MLDVACEARISFLHLACGCSFEYIGVRIEYMEARRKHYIGFWVFKVQYFFSVLSALFLHCDARRTMLLSEDISHPKFSIIKHLQILEVAKNLDMVLDVSLKDSSNAQPYVSSPLTLPPYDSLSPIPLPDTSPPFCVYPPPLGYSPTPPLPSYSSPIEPMLSPPLGPIETPPPPFAIVPSPPSVLPGPTTSIPSPYSPIPNPPYYEPSPPSGGNTPSPPEYVPSPIGFTPGPPIFLPPVVFPPPVKPLTPPTIGGGGGSGGGEQRTWCVAKPSVPDPILQEALNYACGSGADCAPIQPNGQCYQPNSLVAHASYAFNSYWQRTKVAGGTCGFGGIAILVTVDPSSEDCHFVGN